MDYIPSTQDKFSRSSRTRTLHHRDTVEHQYDDGRESVPCWAVDEKIGERTVNYSEVDKRLFFTCEEDSDMGFVFETARNSPYSSDVENDQSDQDEEKEFTSGDNSTCFSNYNSNSRHNHLIVAKKTSMSDMFLKRESTGECVGDSPGVNLIFNQNDSVSAGQKEAFQLEFNNKQDDDSDNGDYESSNETEILFERFKEIDYDFHDPGHHSPSSLSFACGSEECICHEMRPQDKASSTSPSSSSTDTPYNLNQNQRRPSEGKSKHRAPTPEEITRFWTSPSLPEPFQLSEMIIKLLRENECL